MSDCRLDPRLMTKLSPFSASRSQLHLAGDIIVIEVIVPLKSPFCNGGRRNTLTKHILGSRTKLLSFQSTCHISDLHCTHQPDKSRARLAKIAVAASLIVILKEMRVLNTILSLDRLEECANCRPKLGLGVVK